MLQATSGKVQARVEDRCGVFVRFCALRTKGRLLTSGHSVLIRTPEISDLGAVQRLFVNIKQLITGVTIDANAYLCQDLTTCLASLI